MTFLSLLAALLLDQVKPLPPSNPISAAFSRYAAQLERWFNAGETSNGFVAWVLAIVPIAALALAIYHLLYTAHPVLGWMWNVGVLYLTLGFRQFSSPFTAISKSLQDKDLDDARAHLSGWLGESASEFNDNEIARVAIERGLVLSHRYVFAPMFWFVVAPGPLGPLVYRMAWLLDEQWTGSLRNAPFARFARRAFDALDWIPVRLTAISFAIVGDFEDAVYCWREQARGWFQSNQGILLASAGGALGVRLGDVLHQHGTLSYRPELGIGDEADADYLQSAVGLVWRALLLWLGLILLTTIAYTAG